jgi:NAD(P)-dependent dehydrogenase (short-subunit alcohol dehydrogenase family)
MTASKRALALVTGAAGDMGEACARLLAGRCALLLTDVDERGLERVVAAMPGGTPVYPVVADLRSENDRDRLLEAARSVGGLRWLAHVAGLSPAMASGRLVLEVDLVATAALLAEVRDDLQPGGVAVCIASIAGHLLGDDPRIDAILDAPLEGDPTHRLMEYLGSEPDSGIAYALAKRGLIRLCERLAPSWGRIGRRIVSISPGLIDTSMGRLELERTQGMADLLERVPLVRQPQPDPGSLSGKAEDIARAVDFLCSDGASFISGCDLRIDGGLIPSLRG